MQTLLDLTPSSYSLAIDLFIRSLGAIYIIAYVPFLFQIKGLLGKEGIRPVNDLLLLAKKHYGKKRFYYLPTFFWWNASDTALLALIWTGIILGGLVLLGNGSALLLLLLYLVHLSLVSAGQDFLSFGWETFLLELTFGATLLVATTPYNAFAWIGLNFLLFRFFVEAGASKILSRDANWRNLTALWYHYFTQPLPNTTAWFVQKLPMWFHKLSCVIMLFIEICVPIAIFLTAEFRFAAFCVLFALQFAIWFTGNLSYLNHLTVVACLILIHNQYLEPYFSLSEPSEPSFLPWYIFISILGSLFFFLQVNAFCHMFFRIPFFHRILVWIESLHLAIPHGIFAVMTTKRYEIIIEGSDDGVVWKEYEFRYKPCDVAKRAKRVAPYQPRLDWQAWFLPFRPFSHQWWFQEFLIRLLQGSQQVINLLKSNPFPDQPPKYIRVLLYDYEFTTWEEKKQTGNFWKRVYAGEYCPAIHLTNKTPK